MLRKITLALILGGSLLLAGCGGLLEFRDEAFQKGGEFYDDALDTAVLWKCRAASIGSVERRYMRTQDTWGLWVNECLSENAPEIPDTDENEVELLPRIE